MRAVALLLAFIASAFAYNVTTPRPDAGWTNVGAQPLVWVRVSSDSENFTVLLDNQSIPGFSPQVLAALVDGSLARTNLNPPSGGWPTGSHFRVNLVKSPNDLHTIYAQSEEFNISTPNQNSTTSSTSIAVYSTSTFTDTASPSDTGLVAPAAASGALANYSVSTGVIFLLSLFAYTLA